MQISYITVEKEHNCALVDINQVPTGLYIIRTLVQCQECYRCLMEKEKLRDRCSNTRKEEKKLYIFKNLDNFTSTLITEENKLD